MAVILFLMDTSGSMNQRTCLGPTYLDHGKIAIEYFLKIRGKDHANSKDRYLLVTCDEFPSCIKVGWRDVTRDVNNTTYFREELTRLIATSMTNLGGAIKSSLDLLNIHRVQNGLDNYGQGRNPFLFEPAVVVIISDGCKLTNTQTVTDTLTLPMHPSLPGSELTKDPFRWDQRIFSIVLRFKGNVDNDFVDTAPFDSQINAMCEVTGGRSYAVATQKSLYQALESINQKVLHGVVVQLEHLPADAERTLVAEAWHSTRRMIFVNKTMPNQLAHWPIPENFRPARDVRPIRTAIPLIYFSSESKRVNVIDNLPFDKYELEPSPLTQYLLEMRQPTIAWQTFVKYTGRDKTLKGPFGYLKASVKGTCVNLFVMPYNYPVLFPLLEELLKEHRMQPTNQWITDFKTYVSSIPCYYFGPLRIALRRLGVPGSLQALVPEGGETTHYANMLKSLKVQAKTEATRYLDQIKVRDSSVEVKLDVPRKHVSAQDVIDSLNMENIKGDKDLKILRNPFHTPQTQILSQLDILRREIGVVRSCNSTSSLADERARFNLPSCKMGQYQEAFSRALRPVDAHLRNNHMFGNPFKLGNSSKKQLNAMPISDELDEARLAQKPTGRRKQLPLKSYPAPGPPQSNSEPVTPPTPLLSAVSPPPTPEAPTPFFQRPPAPASSPVPSFQRPPAPASAPPSLPPPTPASMLQSQPTSLPNWMGGNDMRLPPSAPSLASVELPKSFSPSKPGSTDAPPRPAAPPAIAPKLGAPPPPISPKSGAPTPWVFTPGAGPDIAAGIGTRTDRKPSLEAKKPKPNTVIKENVVSINPSMRESFLKFSDNDSFIDKSKIRDNFGGDTNGVARDSPRQDVDSQPKIKKAKLATNLDPRKDKGDIKRDNKRLKELILKEVRKPGKNYDQIFHHLNQVKGGIDTKGTFVESVIVDAEKFKKKLLIERLKSWQRDLTKR